MNFQVAACVSLQGHKIKYVYPENNGVHLFIFDNENNIKKELIPLPPAIDVLRLHGIKAKRIDKKVLLPSMVDNCLADMDITAGNWLYV